ncbi:uncharacterized protein LOC129569834 [Sitodiplosis mosellana]|uniref:uncharacterized protein LOC129569834 n=1 Tax=Sitodiplosis mosellana TaxID=263140 RepID=UPI002444BC43|nr:uncharacterized protein LOC129569834 [Sitodiplosis mosellana]
MKIKTNCHCEDAKSQNNRKESKQNEDKDRNKRNGAVDTAEEVNLPDIKDDLPPSIFKLDIDCCEELFEYLPLRDLHSLGQTCKRMHRFTGYFVRENYKSTWFQWENGNFTQFWPDEGNMNGFVEFISRLRIMSDTLKRFAQFVPKFKSIKELKLDLNGGQIDCIQGILPKCEKIYLSIYRDMFADDLYDLYGDILMFCTNLTHFKVNVNSISDVSFENDNNWMLHEYPKLEYLDLHSNTAVKPPIGMIKRFFALNRGIRRFQTNVACLWDIRHWLLNTNIKLDELSVNCLHLNSIDDQLKKGLIDLLNTLYERGFYKRLSLHDMSDFECDRLVTTRIPPAIYMFICAGISSAFPPLNIKEFGIFAIDDADDLETFLANNISTIERIKIQYLKTFDNILFAIRKSKNLREINIKFLDNKYSLDLITLNNEREKLIGASNVTINLSRHNYDPKMKMTHFDLVRIKCSR